MDCRESTGRCAIGAGLAAATFSENLTTNLALLMVGLQLPVAKFLSWHELVMVWSILLSGHASARMGAWRQLVATVVADRGHDEVFLADISTLRGTLRYGPFIVTYSNLYPDVAQRVLSHSYAPERMCVPIFTSDDSDMLALLLDTHGRLSIDIATVRVAIDYRAARCLKMLLAESTSADNARRARVRIENASWHVLVQPPECLVDFRKFPQCLLWRAALTLDVSLCDMILSHMCIACGAAAASSLRLWAACCGVACGSTRLLVCAGDAAINGAFARVSFQAPDACSTQVVDTPLVVVAASYGHADVLEYLASQGADLRLCTPRGVTVCEAAQQHHAQLRERLIRIAHGAGAGPLSLTHVGLPRYGMVSAPISGRVVDAGLWKDGGKSDSSGSSGTSSSDPLSAAIERADITGVRALLERGAQLGGSDIMSAVRSGDLDMLALVQEECREKASSHVEYRQMMRQTVVQIHSSRRIARQSHSSSSLRRAGDAMLHSRSQTCYK